MKKKVTGVVPVLAIFHALVTSLFISISASVNADDLNVNEVIRNPSLGVENTVYVGDTIYEQTVGEVVQCLVPLVEKEFWYGCCDSSKGRAYLRRRQTERAHPTL